MIGGVKGDKNNNDFLSVDVVFRYYLLDSHIVMLCYYKK
jgi:hypothetical protein